MPEADNLWIAVGHVLVDHELEAAFVIDARQYADHESAFEVFKVAEAELRRRDVGGQLEIREVRPEQTVPFDLPNWDDYRRVVLGG
jgi:hypothetical protein